MRKCPNCGSYMVFRMTYNYGQASINYHCDNCNYDTNQETIVISNTTMLKEKLNADSCEN